MIFEPDQLKPLNISVTASLHEALLAIESGGEIGAKMAAVNDASGKMIGIITDGDIRRALIAGTTLSDSVHNVMNDHFACLKDVASSSQALDKMKALSINQLPVLDADGKLAGLYILEDLIGHLQRPNAAMIMAGGKGTRLGAITKNTPKPMVRIAGRPILEHIISHLVVNGIQHVYLSVNHLAEVIADYFGNGASFGCSITYVQEDKPLGTAGALSLLPAQKQDLLLMNGDLITQFSIDGILQTHEQRGNAITVGARHHKTSVPYGVLNTEGHRITCVEEKPEQTFLINGGVYVLSPEAVARVPKDTFYTAMDLVDAYLNGAGPVGYHLLEEDWIDIGEPHQLTNARGG